MSPRKLAFDVLKKMGASGQYSNIAIDKALASAEMNESDRGLFTVIVMGVLERRITLDFIIDRLAADSKRIENDVRILLRIGLYQLMFLDRVPEYAAINETVSLAPRRVRGFVNAMLRSYLRKREGIEYPDRDKNTVEHISVKYSFPIELTKRFIAIFGAERTCKIFDFYNQTPPMTLRVNTLKVSREEYAKMLDAAGVKYELTENSPNGIRAYGTSFSRLPMSDEGYFFVQDEASQICVEALGVKEGDFLIDCCSCPGSKSFGAAICMKNAGRILSCDLHQSKLSLVESGAKRLGVDVISTLATDARKFDESLYMSADVVLCDAPCSGFGVMAKKPEIRYKDLAMSDGLPKIQSDILENACGYVKVGGALVYSTCTVFSEENTAVVKSFLDAHPEFAAEDFSVGSLSSEDGMMSLSPDIHKTDGFFIAKMRRL